MLALDADYTSLALLLGPECERRKIVFEVTDLNSQDWGDVLFSGLAGTYSGEIKGAAEILGSLDHVEAQLQKQIPNCDRPFLCVYGRVERAEDGNCYALTERRVHNTYDRPPHSGIQRDYDRMYIRQNYLGYRTKLARFSSLGVEVFEVPDLPSLAVQLVALYTVATTEGHTFTRLIPEHFIVSEQDAAKRQFMLSVMGLSGAQFGEELADALWPHCRSMVDIMHALLAEGGEASIAKLPLRSGKRTVGSVATARLSTALGLGGNE